jgi:drug/metabolite transporter (DMT)-like permease
MARTYLILALGVVSLSFAAIFIRLADAPPLVIAAYRLSLAALLISPVAWIRSGPELRRLIRNNLAMTLLSGAFLALHFVLWISSLSYTTVASSVVLVTTSPIFVAIASHFLFHEKLSRHTILGIVICLVGAVLIGYGDWRIGSKPFLGDMLAFFGTLSVVGYLLIGRRLRQNTGLLSYSCLVYSSAALFLLLAVFTLNYRLSGYSATTYLMFVLLALLPQILGHLSINWALGFVPATLVAIAVLGEPVGAAALAFVILNESPTFTQIGGSILILSGVFVAFRRSKARLLA